MLVHIIIEYPDSAIVVDMDFDEPGFQNTLKGCLVVNGNETRGTRAVGFCEIRLTREIRDLAIGLGFVFLDDPMDAFC